MNWLPKAAMSPCPASWNASRHGCIRITTVELLHHECVDYCGMQNASLYCVRSAEQHALVSDLLDDFARTEEVARVGVNNVWLGNHRGSESGWDGCVSGGEPSDFRAWEGSEPAPSEQYECIYQRSSDHKWKEGRCYTTQRHCLCELGATASFAYETFAETYMNRLRMWTAFLFAAIIPGLSVLPLLPRGLKAWCGSDRRSRRHHDRRRTAAAADTVEKDTASRLAAAERAAASLRERVSGTMRLLAWSLFVFGFAPMPMLFAGLHLVAVAGAFSSYLAAMSFGLAFLLLSLRPIDTRAITIACRCCCAFLLLNTGVILSMIWVFGSEGSTSGDSTSMPIFIAGGVLSFVLALALTPTVFSIRGRCGLSTMPARTKLRRLWITVRVMLLVLGLFYLSFPIAYAIRDLDATCTPGLGCFAGKPISRGMLVSGPITIFCALILGPSVRGAVHRWLSALGKSGDEQQKAASVAALISGSGRTAASALKLAEEIFRALPIGLLDVKELMDNKASTELFMKTLPAKLGECAAFVSHSWSDPFEPKYNRIQEFGGDDPEKLIWLDKACIDQQNIDASLAVLPIFLAGCKSLLVLPGSTYATRLWCATVCPRRR